MSDSLTPVISQQSPQLFCQYQNYTNSIQVIRISNIQEWFFERTVFPGQRLFFEAPATAILEVHTGAIATTIVTDSIPCRRLVTLPHTSALAA